MDDYQLHASHLRAILSDPKILNITAREISKFINKDKRRLKTRAIAVTGLSGTLIAGFVSYLTNLPLLVVRKDEKRHSNKSVEIGSNIIFDKPSFKEFNYVFLDDLIASGDTLIKVESEVSKSVHNILNRSVKANLVKIYLFHSNLSTRYRKIEVQSFYYTDAAAILEAKKNILKARRKSGERK